MLGLIETPATIVTPLSLKFVKGVIEPCTLILWEPDVDEGTVNVAVQLPFASTTGDAGFVAIAAPSYVTVIPVSLAANPEPEIVTDRPGAALGGLMEMAAVTVKGIPCTPVFVTGPEATIVWAPAGDAGTSSVPFQSPFRSAAMAPEEAG